MLANSNSKLLVKNTLMLYFRMFLIMGVSLYTSRIILHVLGAEDFGIYNVVGGFVALFNILSGALSVAISRFISFELGKNNTEIVKKIFTSSMILQVTIGVVICILLATFGLWFVQNKLVIPADRIQAASYVLLISSVAFFINLISIPYNALIIAHERMEVFAYISISEAALKLLVAILLDRLPFDPLIIYSILLVAVAYATRQIYISYCRKHFVECRLTSNLDLNIVKQMFSFTGWAFLGNGSFILKEQGVNILLNIFFGPTVNAARGITVQVNSAVTGFVTNFMTAVRPQITKSYASGDLKTMHNLILKSSKYSFYLMLIICLPVIKNIDQILNLWLISVPEHTSMFIILFLIFALIDCLVQPLMTGLLAEGNIKTYEIWLLVFNIANIPLSYMALKMGFSPESVFYISIFICILIALLRIALSGKFYSFPISIFLKDIFIRICIVTTVALALVYFIRIELGNRLFNILTQSMLSLVATGLSIFIIGLNETEKKDMKNILLRLFLNIKIRKAN